MAEIKQINKGSNPINIIIKLRPYQVLKDLININIIKLQVTKWVKRTGDKENGISNSVDQGTEQEAQSKTKYFQCLNKLKQDIKPAAKVLAVSEPMAIFHPGDGKS